jgi:2,4-dienoyl-CoA reductase-like NADH-dependent reductase (Old Yellow Enzyme family)
VTTTPATTIGDSPIFAPIALGPLRARGRLFKAATSETRATPDGHVTDELLAFYEPIFRAGTPLVITGNSYPSPQGKSTPLQAGCDADDKIPGLRRWADLAHRHGSALVAQINHAGRQVFPASVGLSGAVSASSVTDKVMGTRPRALTYSEVREVVDSFAAAAARCRDAGFDGIQIHSAHGYLVNQFLTPYTNRRRDEYGGGFANRLRLLIEIHRAVRSRVDDRCAVILKLNGTDYLPLRRGLRTDELIEIARVMQEEGVDAVEISVGHYESGLPMVRGTFDRYFPGVLDEGMGPHMPRWRRTGMRIVRPLAAAALNLIWPHREGFNLRYARRFKAALRIPVICVGGFQTRAAMEQALREQACDAISSGRTMIADPLLYRHLREGTAGPRCVFCNACVARVGGRPVDCYHPDVRAEKDRMLAAELRTAPASMGAGA